MSDPFDPYRQWLGIKDPARPPNHYRLLGVELFESDTALLSCAADRQMGEVDRHRTGPYAAQARQLLGELQAARQCLLHPQRKAEYDAWLRQRLPPPTPPPVIRTASQTPAPTAAAPKASHLVSWLVTALTFVVLVLIGAIAFLANHRQRQAEVAATAAMAPLPVTPEPPLVPELTSVPKLPANVESLPPSRPALTVAAPPTPPVAEAKPQPKLEPLPVRPPLSSVAKPAPKLEAKPVEKPAERPVEKLAAKPVEKPVEKPALPALPSETELAKTQAEVRRKYRTEFQNDDPEAKVELTRKLVAQALAESDRTVQFAFLSESLDLAADAGAVRIFGQLTKLIAERFAVDQLELKVERLSRNARHARPAEANQALAQLALEVADEALTADQFAAAVRAGEAAREMARRAKDGVRLKQAAAMLRDVIARQEAHATDLKATEALTRQPDDLRANLLRGKYLCFLKGDWATGLTHLSKGGDPVLRRLAEVEKQPVETAAQRASLGDQWWDAVKLLDEACQEHAKRRAAWWYAKALPELTGAAKARAKKRIDETEEAK
jgi:hypothetical protein